MTGAGGGKRGGRKPKNVEPDDRPRGYEATRMRQLWRDIDDAKHKAGLAPAPESSTAAPWDLSAMLELAAAFASDAAAWLSANAPAACAIITSGTELLRGVPVIGRLVDLMPTPPSAAAPPGRKRPGAPPNGNGRGAGRPVRAEPEDGEPNGKWIH
jgi:hypothetical protein